MNVKLKRAYERPDADDGFRVLVDRLWPRGVAKSSAKLDLWLKEIAPSAGLREWFGHDPKKWKQFRTRYLRELKGHSEEIAELLEHARRETVTLVFGAKDEEHNDAVVLKEYLESNPIS